jgi:hypothetical protein
MKRKAYSSRRCRNSHPIWSTDYDWRKCEAKLNAQFITTIDGLDIHFIHVRSKNANALPITHGWPGSIIEQLKIIGPLTDPTAYGGKIEDSFDVVIPSLPSYGFSGKPTTHKMTYGNNTLFKPNFPASGYLSPLPEKTTGPNR